jgi:hypothetical protein
MLFHAVSSGHNLSGIGPGDLFACKRLWGDSWSFCFPRVSVWVRKGEVGVGDDAVQEGGFSMSNAIKAGLAWLG